MIDFEQVWQQILEIARTKKPIYTLTQKIRNDISFVNKNTIIVVSEKTGKPRKLSKRDFRKVWDYLRIRKQITCRRDEEVIVFNQRIIMSFLACLPNVRVTLRPQTLHLTDC